MIDFYTWKTPNGMKVSIALEEMEIPYKIIAINIGKGEQFSEHFLAVNPNNKIPAITDHQTSSGEILHLSESAAILFYLAEKTGKFLSNNPINKAKTLQWLFFQMASVGPNCGQYFHFRNRSPLIPYALERFQQEIDRLLQVIDKHLSSSEFFAAEYSIADMAHFPWLESYQNYSSLSSVELPHLERWKKAVQSRPAVQKAKEVVEQAMA